MRTALVALTCVLALRTAANAQPASAFRLFLAAEGVAEQEPLNGLSPTLANPVLDTWAHPKRLYIWAQVLGTISPQKYFSIGLDIRTSDQAEVFQAGLYNYTNGLARWEVVIGGQLRGGEFVDVGLFADPLANFGVADNSANGLDGHFDPVTGATLIGWVDVNGNGNVFLEINDFGILGTAGECELYLGFGDENNGLTCSNPWGRSTLPEATLVNGGCVRDLNCDGLSNGGDIDPFLLALGDPEEYRRRFPNCDPSLADINCDGAVNGGDIDRFFVWCDPGPCPCWCR